MNSNIRINRRSDRRANGSKNLRVFGNIEWGSLPRGGVLLRCNGIAGNAFNPLIIIFELPKIVRENRRATGVDVVDLL